MSVRRRPGIRSTAASILVVGLATVPRAATSATVAVGQAATSADIVGAWSAVEYRLASGPVHPVGGQIFFVDGRWQVAFFVLDVDGTPRRGSAEGGSYRLEGDRLTFMHEINFSGGEAMPGLPAAPLRMTRRPASQAAAEAARVEVAGDMLTLFFPSGNSMSFARSGVGS